MYKKLKVRRAVKKPHIKKDDQVVITAGKRDNGLKGKTGRVLSVDPEKGTAIVEGLNMIKKHTKPNKNVGKGGIIEKEGPIALSNISLLAEDGKTATHAKYIVKEGKRVRVDAKTERDI